MRVDAFEKILDAETLAADMLHLPFVLFVDGLHDKAHQHRAFAAQLFQIDFLRVVRAVHRAAVMDEVAHLHVEQQRFGGVLHVEGVETAVLRDDGHIRFVGKISHGSLHADDVLRSVGFPGNQVGRA